MNLSFEFFPPRTTKAKIKLAEVRSKLITVNPEYFSITFGAGGTTQNATFNIVEDIVNNEKVAIAPHISCIGSQKTQIKQLLDKYKKLGIKKIIALRGDIPSGMHNIGEFKYAYQLVDFIKNNYNDTFSISVAAYPETHPQAKNYQDDIKNFVNKIKAGADEAITQYFYNIDSFLFFRDIVTKLGVDKIIIPGIMPITNYQNLVRFSNMCYAEIPRWIIQRLEFYQHDKKSLQSFGFEVVNNLCLSLKNHGVNDFHFYTMNKTNPALQLSQNLI